MQKVHLTNDRLLELQEHYISNLNPVDATKVSDFVVVLITRVNEELNYQYLDFLTEHEPQDFYYVETVWLKILEETQLLTYQNWIIWSDRGPQHFMVGKTL